MKRTIFISLVVIALICTGTILYLNKSDYHGKIGEINQDNFSVAPLKIDPEAQYNAPPIIYFDDHTEVVGKINKVSELQVGQEVKVWVTENEVKKIADKIEVINEGEVLSTEDTIVYY